VTKPFDPAELRARVRASLRTKYLMDLLSRKAMIDGLTGLFQTAPTSTPAWWPSFRWPAGRSRRSRASCWTWTASRISTTLTATPSAMRSFAASGRSWRATAAPKTPSAATAAKSLSPSAPTPRQLLPPFWPSACATRLRGLNTPAMARDVRVTCSFGVADLHGAPQPSVVELADQALYLAKQSGRNRVIIAEHEENRRQGGVKQRVYGVSSMPRGCRQVAPRDSCQSIFRLFLAARRNRS